MRSLVRQVHVVLRHGDRLPAFNPSEGCPAAEALEKQAWGSRAHSALALDGAGSWGVLSAIGARQSRRRGELIRARYDSFGRVTAVASNFSRTQQSLCEVLTGMGCQGERVHVPHPASCTLAVFERHPSLWDVQKRVYATPDYTRKEALLRHISDTASQVIPFFATGRGQFMWIKLMDLFACYNAHGFPVPSVLRPMEQACHDHLTWRFRTFFSYACPLRLAAAGFLRGTANTMIAESATSTDAQSSSSIREIHVSCGHDVTLLPVLMALAYAANAASPIEATFAGGSSRRIVSPPEAVSALSWPAYASMLTMELRSNQLGGNSEGEGQHGPTHNSCWDVRWCFENEEVQVETGVLAPTPAGWGAHWPSPPDLPCAQLAVAGLPRPHPPRLERMEGRLPLSAFLQLVEDVEGERLGMPLPASQSDAGG